MLSGTTISKFVADNFFYLFLGLAALTIVGRRMGRHGYQKRMAIVIQAIAVFLLVAAGSAVMEFGGNDRYLILAAIAIGAVLATVLRKRAFPYRRTCPSCGTKLDTNTIMFRDDHLCPDCRPKDEES